MSPETARRLLLSGLFLLALPGVVLRLGDLTVQPLTWDELAILRWSDGGPAALIARIAREDAHPPLFYLAQDACRRLLPSTVIPALSLRILPALTGLAAPLLLFLLLRRRLGSETATLAGLLLLFNPEHAAASAIGRMYAPAVFLLLLALLLLEQASRSRRTRDGVLAGLSALAAALTHYYCLFVLPVILLFVPRPLWKALALPGRILAAGFSAWLLVCLHLSRQGAGSGLTGRLTAWLDQSPGQALIEGLRLLDFDLFFCAWPGLALFLLTLAALCHPESRALALAALLPALALAFASSLIHLTHGSWTLQGRQLVLLSPFAASILAVSVRHGRWRWLLIPPLLAFALLAFGRHQAGQRAMPGLFMLQGELGTDLQVPDPRDRLELLVNFQLPTREDGVCEARPLLTRQPLPGIGRAGLHLSGAHPRWYYPKAGATAIRLRLPELFWPFRRKLSINVPEWNSLPAGENDLTLDAKRLPARLACTAADPEWFAHLHGPGWLLLVLLLGSCTVPLTGPSRTP